MTSIRIDAFDGVPIPNGRDAEPSNNMVQLAKESLRLEIASSKQLAGPSGNYNCHGLVFASRRTCIPPPGMRDTIDFFELLDRDGYEQTNSAQIGDLVVYADERDVQHTGIGSML